MITANLTWKIECSDCSQTLTENYSTDWFSGWTCGQLTEEDLSGDNIIEMARLNGWDFERVSFEDLKPFCPNCKTQ